ncbi:MAG: SIR2 family protein [Proteobacteria bacterium]|nr:SIR2 family protein [Pseudomonadota bacterium]
MDLREAVTLVHQQNSILLLGAGFSTASVNVLNRSLPTGSGLAAILASELGVAGTYPLPVIATRYLSKFGSEQLTQRLQDIFTSKTVSVDQARIALLPWRRIYTLNYDDIVEHIYRDNSRPLVALNSLSRVKNADGPPQCIHLHGELHSGNMSAESIVLSSESYNLNDANSGWFTAFRNDIELADSVIAIGCSLSDVHISSIFFKDPVTRSKTFFVDIEDMDEIWRDNLSLYGEVFPIGVRAFADLVASVGSPPPTRRTEPVAFERYKLPSETKPPSGGDVFNLVLLGDVKPDILPATRPDTKLEYVLWRDDAETIINRIDASDSPVRVALHSGLGNGKTVALESLKLALAQRGFTVLTLKSARDLISADLPFLRSLTGRVVIICEDVFRTNNRRDITTLVEQFPRFSFIVTCRTSIFELQGNELHMIIGSGYEDYDLNFLSEREAAQIVDWFNVNGLWGADASASQQDKMAIITRRCGREWRSILLDRFKSGFIRRKIDSVFRSIPEGRFKKWLLYILIMDLCGFDTNPRFVREISGLVLNEQDLKMAGGAGEFFDKDAHRVRIKSPVLASVLVSEMYDAESKIEALFDIAKSCDRASNGRDTYSELIKFMYRPAIMAELFHGSEYINSVKAVFDKLKTIESLRHKSLFWLQYAIVLTNEKEYFGAKIIFDTAFGQARNSDFDTFHVDNHFARFLLESRMFAPDQFGDPFYAFTEAHKRLRSQIIRDRGSTHPYRVAEIYPDFAEILWDKFDARQRVVVRRSLVEMRDFLHSAPTRHGRQKISETLDRLNKWLDSHS